MLTKPIKTVSLLLFTLGMPLAHADSWDGIFVGLNGGAASATAKYQTGPNNRNWFASAAQTSSMWANGAKNENDTSLIGGLSLAYNRQVNSFVFGGEVGLNIMDADLQRTATHPYQQNSSYSGTENYTYNQKTIVRGLFTLKGRAGYAFGNSLLSATAGLAASQLKTSLYYEDSYPGTAKYIAHHNTSKFKFGWTAGVAYEYMFPGDIVLKAEYQYVDLGKTKFSTPVYDGNGINSGVMNFSSKVDMNTFMIGIEKKF